MLNYKLILLYIVETFFMLYVGISIFKIEVDRRRILYTMILYGISIYSVRNLYEVINIPLGTHTIILLGLFSLYTICVCKMSVIQAISTGYIAYTLETIGEWTITTYLINKCQLTVNAQFFESWQGILIGFTAYTFLVILTIFFWGRKKYVEKKNNYRGMNRKRCGINVKIR